MSRIDWKKVVDREEGNIRYCHTVFHDYVKELIENFPFEDYDADEFGASESFAEKVNFVRRVFESEVGNWKGKSIYSIEYWIAGLCNLNVPFRYCDIIELAHKMVERKTWTEKFEAEFCDRWFGLVAEEVAGFFRRYFPKEE